MEVLNQTKVDSLAQEIGEENVPILVEIFLGELDMYQQNLSSDQLDDKVQYLKEISHALKSSAASFGAELLCAKAADIDSRGKSGEGIHEVKDTASMIELLLLTHQRYSQLPAK